MGSTTSTITTAGHSRRSTKLSVALFRSSWASDGRRCATVMPGHSTIAGRKRAVTRRPRGVSDRGALLWDQESQRRGVCGAEWPLIEALPWGAVRVAFLTVPPSPTATQCTAVQKQPLNFLTFMGL